MAREFLKTGTLVRLPKEPARFSASSGRMYEKAKPARRGHSITDLVFGTVVHRSRESFEVLADAQ